MVGTIEQKSGLVSSFSGADVTVIFGNAHIGECMAFTYGVNREAGPLYVLGRKEPISIPKGKRGIGGSFILAQLGRDALLQFWSQIKGSDQTPIWIRKDEMVTDTGLTQYKTGVNINNENDLIKTINTSDGYENLNSSDKTPNYVDQLPPFTITVIGRNEQGHKMGFRVYGVQIINDGMAISTEELNMEKKYTFIATAVSRMIRLDTSGKVDNQT